VLVRTIVASEVEVPSGVHAGSDEDAEVTLLGRGVELTEGQQVPAGSILPEVTGG
jgi:hypothetical protein